MQSGIADSIFIDLLRIRMLVFGGWYEEVI